MKNGFCFATATVFTTLISPLLAIQLQNAIYSPVAHGDLENNQIKIRKGLASVFSGETPLKMEVTNIPATRKD